MFHPEEETLNSNELARQIVDIIEDKQATEIVLLDVSEQTSIAGYFVIATIDNERQGNAIRDDLHEKLHIQHRVRPLNHEGMQESGGGWVLLDYGDVILHLFTKESREYYNLEELWQKANVVMKIL
ncbi:MAG: ribosome silencing factor [Caldilineaceae bacterium]